MKTRTLRGLTGDQFVHSGCLLLLWKRFPNTAVRKFDAFNDYSFTPRFVASLAQFFNVDDGRRRSAGKS
jgi:hypothetical protein